MSGHVSEVHLPILTGQMSSQLVGFLGGGGAEPSLRRDRCTGQTGAMYGLDGLSKVKRGEERAKES